MKGLLTQDMLWMLSQKRALIITLTLILIYMFTDMAVFGMVFGMMLIMIWMIKSIVFDLGPAGKFLFTLPFSRKIYVAEKYLASLGGSFVTGLLISIVLAFFKGTPDVWEAFGSAVLMCLFMAAILVPVTIRFKERSRLIIMIMALAVCLPMGLADGIEIPAAVSMNIPLVLGIIAGCAVLALVVSVFISLKIVAKLEF